MRQVIAEQQHTAAAQGLAGGDDIQYSTLQAGLARGPLPVLVMAAINEKETVFTGGWYREQI